MKPNRLARAIAVSLLLSATVVSAHASEDGVAPATVTASAASSTTASTTATTTATGTAAAATEAQAEDDAPAGTGEAKTLAQVTVTAQKREQAALDVPASVTALDAQRLSNAGMTQLEDYAAQVPGLSITSNGSTMQVTLRGISTGLSQASPTTSIYIDEAPIGSVNAYAVGSALAPDLDPAELRQIEIGKGPQGTLFGAGAMGGVLRYVTAGPNLDDAFGSITLGGSDVAHGGTGSIGRFSFNAPLSQGKAAVRVSAFNRNEPGYIDNTLGSEDFNDANVHGGRVAVAANLGETWRMDLWAMTHQRDASGSNQSHVDRNTLEPTTGEYEVAVPFDLDNHYGLDVYNLTLKGALGRFDVVSATTWQNVEADLPQDLSTAYGTLLGLVTGDFDYAVRVPQTTDTDRFSQEFRLETTAFDDRLYWSGGVYYTEEDNQNRIAGFELFSRATGEPRIFYIPGTAIPFPGGVANARIDTSYREVSLFSNATWTFSDAWSAQLGLRYGEDRQEYEQYYSGLLFTPPVALEQDSNNEKFTWLLSSQYKPDENNAFYARLANGYRPGGPSAATPLTGMPPTVDSDSLTSFELGWKSLLADDRVSIEAALFHTQWDDIQIQTSSAGSNYFVNGGAAISQGGELTIGWLPLDGLSVRGSVGYTDAHLTEDTDRVVLDPGTPFARPLGVDGDPLPFVPEWTSSLAIDYGFVVGAWQASLGGSVGYVGDRESNYTGRGSQTVSSYTTVDAHASLSNDRWLFTLYGKNLTDDDGIIHLADTALLPFTPTAPYLAGQLRPRTIGIDATVRF